MKFKADLFDFNISTFSDKALQLFHFQYRENMVYRTYCDGVGSNPGRVKTVSSIPFLPIGFFKTHEVTSTVFTPEICFESSGTTGIVNSRHAIKDISMYTENFLQGFRKFYGEPASWCIIGLLPSYLERQNSSLVMMVDELVKLSGHPQSGFYLYDHERLYTNLLQLESKHQPVILIGVTYALLDFAEKFPMPLQHTLVMETGGMKGRREEMTRIEVHDILKKQFGLNNIHSEYGMTEMLSQAYSGANGIFHCSDSMQVLIREEDDPFVVQKAAEGCSTGIINVIDLANIWSCAFIATEDTGKLYADGSFEVLGRVDYGDLRGCSLMVV
jgi:Acyl-protein synthetase, LuxE